MIYQKSKAKSIIANKSEIKDIVADTMDRMATVVGATLGPGGRAVLIERDGLAPLVTKDGVTVAKSLGVANAEANVVIEAAKEICLNTAKEAGDGTTTAIVLANAITKHGLSFLEKNTKYNPQRMINELNQAYEDVIVPFLKSKSKKASSEEELVSVAKISANGDEKIARSVVKAVMAAGEDGTVLVEEAQGHQIRVETMDGFVVTSGLKDLGQLGPVFINDRANQQSKMDNGLVFLYDGTLNDLKAPSMLQQIIEGTDNYGKPIIIFAHGFADVVMDRLAKTTKGGYMVVPVKTPMTGVANSRSMFLHDMAAYTGAKVFDPGNIDELDESDLGAFRTAKVNLYEGVVTSENNLEAVENRVGELKAIAATAPSDFDRMHIKAAIGKLTGGISTIWVGGGSELEAREKKARVEDAVEAVRSAIAEGVVPGGCGVHLTLSSILQNHEDYKPSWKILIEALKAPFNLLLSNCGEDFNEVLDMMTPYISNTGALPSKIFDANAHQMVSPMETGIIEPAKVCRVSIGNALSVASLLITLGGMVVVPRDAGLENQLALSKQAFQDMMSGAGVGQE